jgi:subtilisin-like proprotein convertase family protein
MKTYTAATTAGLGILAGQPISGSWRLAVSDRAGQDIGKLNTWRVVIHPAS